MSRRTSSAGRRKRHARTPSGWTRLRPSARRLVVLAGVLLAFAAGLLLDPAAVLRLTFGWTAGYLGRVSFATVLVAVALVTVALFVVSRGSAEPPAPRPRRAATKRPHPAQQPAQGGRRPGARVRQRAVAEEQPDHEPAGAEPEVAELKAKPTRRRKRVDAGV